LTIAVFNCQLAAVERLLNVLQSQDARLRTEPVALRFNFEAELKKFLNSGYIAAEAEFMIRGAQGDFAFSVYRQI
jgi:hypothetical protein